MRRHHSALLAAAVLGLGTEIPAPVRQSRDGTIFDPSRRKVRGWRRAIPGDAMRDGRGDYRSAKRLHKEALKLVHGVTSGRQWRKLRKRLRRGA